MPIRRSQKKRNAEPRPKQNQRRRVIDPMVNPGSSAHRHQARSKAHPTRTHHRMVTLAQSSPGDRSACAPQSKTATVMIGMAVDCRHCGPWVCEQTQVRGSVSVEPSVDLLKRAACEQRKVIVKVETGRKNRSRSGQDDSAIVELCFETVECCMEIGEEARIFGIDLIGVHG